MAFKLLVLFLCFWINNFRTRGFIWIDSLQSFLIELLFILIFYVRSFLFPQSDTLPNTLIKNFPSNSAFLKLFSVFKSAFISINGSGMLGLQCFTVDLVSKLFTNTPTYNTIFYF